MRLATGNVREAGSSAITDGPDPKDEASKEMKRTRNPPRPVGQGRGESGVTASPQDDWEALQRLEQDKLAPSSRQSAGARVAWWVNRAAARKCKPWPLTRAKVRLAAAILKKGRYRSAQTYLRTMKAQHVRGGARWTMRLEQELKDCIRSCERGLGPPRRAEALSISEIAALPEGFYGDILAPRDAMLVGMWWLMREVELAMVVRSDVTFVPGPGTCGEMAIIFLAVSKTDPAAKGKERRHCCACPSVACPVAAAKRWTTQVIRTLGGEHQGPLLTDHTGAPVTKERVVDTIREAAKLIGVKGFVGGHSLRASGAQHMAMAGIELWRIQVFGRWGSMAILKYVRESCLGTLGQGLASQVEAEWAGKSLGALRNEAQLEVGDGDQFVAASEEQGAAALAVGERVATLGLNWDTIRN